MKKSTLILLTFVPMIVGWLVNALLILPVIGMLGFYVLPLLTTVFWFCLGKQYARSNWKPIPAICIGNAAGIVSVLIYIWQFVFETDETRNIALAVASQMFSAATPMYLFGSLAILFESQPNYVGRTAMVAMHVISIIYMTAVFTVAFFTEKKRMQS